MIQEADKPVVSNRAVDLIAEARARTGRQLRPETGMNIPVGQVWRYTRHLSPRASEEWFRYHRPEWCVMSKPGDAGYPAGQGTCQVCGAATEIKSITTCHACVAAKYKEAI